ncbi:hypothetical protein Tco_1046226 [Tanacetum coccineum]
MIGFMRWLSMEPKTIQKAVQISSALTDEAIRNGSIKKTYVGRESMSALAQLSVVHRLNRARIGRIQPNQVAANNKGQGRGNQRNKLGVGNSCWSKRSSKDTEHCMDWLSNHKAEIICHEKVVRIPLLDGKVLRVLGEKPEEKMRQLKSAKAKEKEQEEIVVVRDFPEGQSGTQDNRFLIDKLHHIGGRRFDYRSDQVDTESCMKNEPFKTAFRTRCWTIFEFTVMPCCRNLRLVLKLLKEGEMYAKFSSVNSAKRSTSFLGHYVINGIEIM